LALGTGAAFNACVSGAANSQVQGGKAYRQTINTMPATILGSSTRRVAGRGNGPFSIGISAEAARGRR
jgi:hypothetical protein